MGFRVSGIGEELRGSDDVAAPHRLADHQPPIQTLPRLEPLLSGRISNPRFVT